ncbi:hypothetical protein ACIQC9_10855 [Brevundimonas sp. NPDC092305]|uniref:hypothetical protein n=1 Tax=Brevundimonas sp. NPDC092305 TaxID=3363957 RepID=UPI0038163B12
MRLLLAFLAAVLLAVTAAPGAARAQLQVSRSPATAPTLGTTIRGSSATTFSISTAGAVTRVSGNAIRLSNAGVTTPTVTVSCGLLNISGLCALRHVRITITPVTGAGPASITRFRMGTLSGASYRSGSAPADASSISFDLQPLGLFGTATFHLGMDVLMAANASSGVYGFDYLVTAEFVL